MRILPVALLSSSLIGCSSTLEPPSGDALLDLRHPDPRIRVLAARETAEAAGTADPAPDEAPDAAAAAERRELIAALIENLDDRDPTVRFFTAIALRKLTDRDFGYEAYGTPDERESAIRRWRDWAGGRDEDGSGGDVPSSARAEREGVADTRRGEGGSAWEVTP